MIPSRLVVFSSVNHHLVEGAPVAHGGFVREIDIWARIFDEVLVMAHLSDGMPLADAIPYHETNISFMALGKPLHSRGIQGKFRLITAIFPRLLLARRQLRPNDTVMARGPDSIGFMGVVLTRFSKRRRIGKYAGQWMHYPGERLSYRIQQWFYRAPHFGGPVLIYGAPEPTKPHLIPLPPSSISSAQWNEAEKAYSQRIFEAPYKLLSVGRLSRNKRVDMTLRTVHQLLRKGMNVSLDVVGEGAERETLEVLTYKLGIADRVNFWGHLNWENLESLYEQAHCLVHSSRSEGTPKVIIEAMAFGLPVIATDAGTVRTLIDPPTCGFLVVPDTVASQTEALMRLLSDPTLARQMGAAGRVKAREMVCEGLEQKYREIVQEFGLITNR